jgi:hypothetical protein
MGSACTVSNFYGCTHLKNMQLVTIDGGGIDQRNFAAALHPVHPVHPVIFSYLPTRFFIEPKL